MHRRHFTPKVGFPTPLLLEDELRRKQDQLTPQCICCWPGNMGGERLATEKRQSCYAMPESSLQYAVPSAKKERKGGRGGQRKAAMGK
jgi:hypothetical protein